MSSPYLIVNRVGSIVPLVKPLDIRKFKSSSYQALGACFNPYLCDLGAFFEIISHSKSPNHPRCEVLPPCDVVEFRRISLTGFRSCASRSQTRASQSRQSTEFYNYIPVSLENQANPHAGTSEATNNAGTSQTPNSNASEEKDKDIELIVVPSAVKITEEKVESRTSSTNLKKEEILTDPQQEKKVYFDEHLMMKEGEITDFNSLPLEIEKAKCSKNQELMLFSAIFKSSKEKITKINNIVCLLVFYLMRNLKKIAEALQDDSWVQAMQEELLQFKLQQVWGSW
ncbi:hypothetical protein Tco_1563871 [Tanacetum coccineum]